MPRRADRCEKCGKVVKIGDWFLCPHESTTRRVNFKPYEVQIGKKTYLIDSIQTAMKIEKQYAREHESTGREIAFQAFHFDNSNRDKNAFGDTTPKKWSPRENIECHWGLPPGVKGE